MPQLDFKTLVFLVACITLVMTGLMFILHKINTGIKGAISWTIGSLFISVGLFQFYFSPYLSNYVAFAISGVFSVIGISQYVSGIRHFKEKKTCYFVVIGLPAIQLIQSTICEFVCDHQTTRMLIYSFIQIVISSMAIYELVTIKSSLHRKVYLITALAFFIYALTMLYRCSYILYIRPERADSINVMNLVWFFVTSFSQTIITFGFMMMVLLRMAELLKLQVASKNKLFRIFTHDLRGPLGTMAAFLEFIRTEKNLDETKKQNYYNEIEKLSESTLEFIKHISDWSKSQDHKTQTHKEWIDLSKLVSSTINMIDLQAKIKGVKINNQLPVGKQVFVDEYMIRTAIRNIISNAVKFSNEGDSITIQCYKQHDYMYVLIKDTGIGMDQVTIEEIMNSEPVNSRSGTKGERGTGLGLQVTKEFITKNHGELHIKSIINNGSTFTISLPAFIS